MEVLLRMLDETSEESARWNSCGSRAFPPDGLGRPLGGANHADCTVAQCISAGAGSQRGHQHFRANAQRPLFLEFVVECLDSTGVPPDQVCFELAESAVVGNIEHARRFVGVLHGMGCKFTVDDFGSGVGSFSSLKNLELDYLKLDGSFMRNLARDSVSQTMVTAMIKLARTLNFKIIAEQVEDSAALDAARKMGVDFVQGFVIARPARLATAA